MEETLLLGGIERDLKLYSTRAFALIITSKNDVKGGADAWVTVRCLINIKILEDQVVEEWNFMSLSKKNS